MINDNRVVLAADIQKLKDDMHQLCEQMSQLNARIEITNQLLAGSSKEAPDEQATLKALEPIFCETFGLRSRTFSKKENDKGLKVGDEIIIVSDVEYPSGYHSGFKRKTKYQGKRGTVVGSTKDYVYVAVFPIREDSAVLRKRNYNVRKYI